MSSGMNMKEAEKIADKMSYSDAIMNCLCAKCVPYRKATKIKMNRLLESIDALNIDLDTPMHFTNEQKAWVKKYISINAERQRADAIDELVGNIIDSIEEIKEWYENLYNDEDRYDVQICIVLEDFNKLADELKGWQKGEEND